MDTRQYFKPGKFLAFGIPERAARGMTQRQVYEAAGISRSAYLRLEDGSRVADTLQLARLCGVYRMQLSRFFHLVEDRLATMRADLDLD